MRKGLIVCAAAACLTLPGCYASDNTVTGAALGAATGAVVGGVATGRVGGALVGGVIGGVAGGVIGAASEPRPRCARRGYDYYGNFVCVSYY